MEKWQLDIINGRIEAVKRLQFTAELDYRVAVRVGDLEAQKEIKETIKRNELLMMALEEELHTKE